MISASEASFQSHHGKKLKQIEANIEQAIQTTSNNGSFHCSVSIDIDTPDDIREYIKNKMEQHGYDVEITDSRNNHISCSQNYYDRINLSWD